MAINYIFSGAINQLTRNLACEWAKDNIRTNTVAPFGVRTTIIKQVYDSLISCHLKETIIFIYIFYRHFSLVINYAVFVGGCRPIHTQTDVSINDTNTCRPDSRS